MAQYVQVYAPHSPHASASGCVNEHVLMAEKALGHAVPNGVEVHHVNGNQRDNRPSNLVICQDAAYHKLLHVRARVVKAGGNPNTERQCGTCKQLLPFEAFRFLNLKKERPRLMAECRDCELKRYVPRVNERVVHSRSRNLDQMCRGGESPQRITHGAAHPKAVLTPEKVRAIRHRRAELPTAPLRVFADEFGVSTGAIYCVLTGKTWRHV